MLDIYNTYRPENETGFYYHIYNFLQKSYCPARFLVQKAMRLLLNVISRSILLNWDLTEKIFGKTENV